MPSKDSSTDDTCRCGHERQDHALTYDPARRRCTVTAGGARCGCAAFWLDTPREEGAGESEEPACAACQGPHATEDCKGVEEPDSCSHESWEVTAERRAEGGGWLKCRRCADCNEVLPEIVEAEPHWDFQPALEEPRPPYAVAYSVGGRLYETYLPGDATATAVDGMLQITHDEPVLAIVSVKPIKEGA